MRKRLITAVGAVAAAHERCEDPKQMRRILAANVAGEGYELGDSVVYEEGAVRALIERPILARAELAAALPGDLVVIVRQWERTPVDPERDTSRPFWGVDATATDAEQRLSSSRYWRIGEARRKRISLELARHGRVPLLVSIGGFIYRGYDITGFDDIETALNADRGGQGWAFELAPGRPEWADSVESTWLNSGRGGSVVVWELDQKQDVH